MGLPFSLGSWACTEFWDMNKCQQPNTKQITSLRVEKTGEWKGGLPLPYRTGADLASTPLGKVLEPQLHLESQIWLDAG